MLLSAATVFVNSSMLLAQSQTPVNYKIAFIGDQGNGSNATAVLNLIKSEGAHAVVHQGDFDYGDNAQGWDNLITSILGLNFPYFASVGNHDEGNFYGANGYQSFLAARMNRLGIIWDGDLGTKSSFKYNGILFVLTAPDVIGTGHDIYIRDKLAGDNSLWSISSWHKNMKLMQVGGKSDDTGWPVYEESRKGGAIIATAHEHSYSRTHLLSNCQNQTIASTSNTLVLAKDDPNTPASDEGRSFVFVSGLGGKSVRSQSLSGAWWASIYTSTQNATYGALFGEFNYNGQPDMARFYFKAINGAQPDAFFVRSTVEPATPPVISSFSPTLGPIGTEVTILGSSFSLATQVAFNGIAAASFTIVSDTEIRVEVPASAPQGGGKITVTNSGGPTTSADDFVVTPPLPPSITSFMPASGPVGTQVTINGANFTGATQVTFNDVTATSFTVLSNTSIRANVPAGAATGPISVTAPGGTATSADEFTVTVPPPILTFNPTDDAYVSSANRTQNNGAATTLRLQQSSTVLRSYLKFAVSGLAGTIQSATLRLRVTVASSSGGSVFVTSNNYRTNATPWIESGINFTNAPNFIGTALSTVGSVAVGQWVDFDVTPAIAGNGTFSFGMRNASSTTVQYSSEEGADKPQLVIQMSAVASARELSKAAALPANLAGQRPDEITLAPSYPNPFNAQTVIEYALPEEAHARLGIYNVMGQLVRQLVDEMQAPGYRSALWNGRDDHGREVSSGIYLYRLQVGPQAIVRRMTLQK